MKPVTMISHRRSGTHFLWETMKLNFTDECFNASIDHSKWHRIPERSDVEKMTSERHCICIIRDCRDTLVSTLNWWKSGAESYYNLLPIVHDLSFSRFLHGVPEERLVGRKKSGEIERHLRDPIEIWELYTTWADLVFTVRFEDVKSNLKETIYKIKDEFGFTLRYDEPKPITRLVGHLPSRGEAGGWKNHFTKEDEEYFWSKSSKRMTELGYRR